MKRVIVVTILWLSCSYQVLAAQGTNNLSSQKQRLPVEMSKPAMAVKPFVAKPDLFVSQFTVMPKITTNGGSLGYTLKVGNKGGNSSQPTMLVGIQVNDPQHGKPITMKVPGAGQSESVTGKIGVGPSNCDSVNIYALLDGHHQVPESNENNNRSADEKVSINNRPELGFCKTTGSCPELHNAGDVGKQIAVCVDVHNYGCAANTGATMTIGCPDQWPINVPLPPITPGQFWAHCSFLTWNAPGMRNCKINIQGNPGQTDAYDHNESITYKVNVVAK